jgi:hypothetical protein
MKKIITGSNLGASKSLATEDGRMFRGLHQDIAPIIRRHEHLRHKVNEATSIENPNGWRHVASVPVTIWMDWMRKNGVTPDQFARNEGGVKQQFSKWFLSRDHSKLHNEHITTKRESSQIVVPNSIGSTDGHLRRAEDGDIKLD